MIEFLKKINPFYWIQRRRRIKKYAETIKYYRANPDVFCEEMLGIKLFDYQKKLLKEMMQQEDNNEMPLL